MTLKLVSLGRMHHRLISQVNCIRPFTSRSNALFGSDEKLKKHQEQLMARGLPKRRTVNGVKQVLVVASGKGGVGKSTIAVNLALALSRLQGQTRLRVGLLDADIFGPSIPIMMGVKEEPLIDEQKRMIPVSNLGLQMMSVGFLVKDEDAVVWRGPMVIGALEKLIHQTKWNDLDCLVIDMPPGTGDTHLSVAQTVQVSGAVVVSTPQHVAMADARKGVNMFTKVGIPVLGIVENMSSFICPNCGTETHIFGEGGGKRLAEELDVALLGSVPIDPGLMAASDNGTPIVVLQPESKPAKSFFEIAQKIAGRLVDQRQ